MADPAQHTHSGVSGGNLLGPPAAPDAAELGEWVIERRQRLLSLVGDLDDDQLVGPVLPIINPLHWEIGHVGWFQERFVLREVSGEAPIFAQADALWDSARVPHDTRWWLRLPSRDATVEYLLETADRVVTKLKDASPVARDGNPGSGRERLLYVVRYVTHHEDWHSEAIIYTRQTLGLPAPSLPVPAVSASVAWQGAGSDGESTAFSDDVSIPGGRVMLGGARRSPFVFDNEKWAHEVQIEPFELARTPVTQSQLADFADDGGYRRRNLWSEEGWAWRSEASAEQPLYWRRGAHGWECRRFDHWAPIEPGHPAVHVNFFEAEAWCRWAHRRLPTEGEWEAAAIGETGPDGRLRSSRRRWPWGDEAPTQERANLDCWHLGTLDVGSCAAGDSAFGARQLIGNVWEWTSSLFGPYPGFERDFYAENSEPWFGSRRVLRGGCWATRSELIRPTLRNYFTPDRRDVFAGLRTVAL